MFRLPKKRPPGNGDMGNPPPAQRFPVQKEAVSSSVLSFISTVLSLHSRFLPRSSVVLGNVVVLDPDSAQITPDLGQDRALELGKLKKYLQNILLHTAAAST